MNRTLTMLGAATALATSMLPSAANAAAAGAEASGTTMMDLAAAQRYFARQHLFVGTRTTNSADPSNPTTPDAPAEPDDPESILRCGVPQQGSTPLGSYDYAERGQSWVLENGPAICALRPGESSSIKGTQCLAQRNKSVSPWTFYVLYGSNPPITGTTTFGRAASSCTFGPGKKVAALIPKPPVVKCGGFTRNLRLGDYGDINDGGYAANLDEARDRCNAIATPQSGYCVAYRNEGSNAPYIILIGGEHGTAPAYGGTEGWVARCE